MTDNQNSKLAETTERQIKANILLQPIKDQAVTLIMKAATPHGLTVTDEGGEYFVTRQGLVYGNNDRTMATSFGNIKDMPAVNVLSWVFTAAESLAFRKPAFNVSSDPTGLGL